MELVPKRPLWVDEFRKHYLGCWDSIRNSISREAVFRQITQTAKTLNRRATNEVRAGASPRVAREALKIIVDIAVAFEKQIGDSIAVQRRNNEVMHRKISKELAQLLAVATRFYDISFLNNDAFLVNLRKLNSTTGTCYEGVLQDIESIVEELEGSGATTGGEGYAGG